MPVLYDSKKIIPAPLVSISKEYHRSADGHSIGTTYTLTLTGRVIACKGSPNSSGIFWTDTGYPADETSVDKFSSLLAKVEALKKLFATSGRPFEIQPFNGSQPTKCFPVIKGVHFQDGQWIDLVEYTITLETPLIYGPLGAGDEDINNDYFKDSTGTRLYLVDAAEDWNVEFNEQAEDIGLRHTYRVSHSIKATGKEAYNDDGYISAGWQQARRWVMSRLGADSLFIQQSSGINIPSYYAGYNHTRVEATDELGGAYSVNESWIFASGAALEEFSVSIRTASENGLTSVSVEGNITGLERRSADFQTLTSTKYTGALAKYNTLVAGAPLHAIYDRALQYSGLGYLNPKPVSTTNGRNDLVGTISYSYEYNNRPANYVVGSLSEVFNFKDSNPCDVFGRVPVLGRQEGPVLQDMDTVTESRKTLTVEVVMPIYSGVSPITADGMLAMMNAAPKTQVDTLVNAARSALQGTWTQVFKEQDEEDWNPSTGRYSRNVSWVYQ